MEKEEFENHVLKRVRKKLLSKNNSMEEIEKLIQKEKDFQSEGHGGVGMWVIPEITKLEKEVEDYSELSVDEVTELLLNDFERHQEEYGVEYINF